MDIFTPVEYRNCFAENALNSSPRKEEQKSGSAVSYDAVFQSVQAGMRAATTNDESVQVAGLVELCRVSFERYFGSVAEKTYYHVMDATSISQQNWCHEDFPFDKFFSDETDDSVLAWQPKRANPSQLSPEIQMKTGATLGKNAIVVPPALDEKMKDDPALREKVAANIAQA